ncbi:MAG TPA: hypothetical protein VMH50_09305 [Thermoleophilia bacterium]|nr:hypothetical protein [Thermoleophilia bacterium]
MREPVAAYGGGNGSGPKDDRAHLAWRDGDLLVMAPEAVLPDRCVKTDLPADGRTAEVPLLWHEPRWYWLLVVNPILYLAVARAVGTRVVVTVPVTREALAAARRARWLTAALLVAGLVSWLAAALLARAELFWLGVVVMALAIPVYLLGARFIRVRRLEGERVWIAGANINFLARLPELPH